ncbi:MAG TPA: DoxX family protein [Nocardioides sp.]|nr:DoxX family protein [Nocardioides sp.]
MIHHPTAQRRADPSTARLVERLLTAEAALHALLRPLALPAMRAILGIVFIWFGVLKVMGRSPVADLVHRTLPWAPKDVVVPTLGAVELVLGIGVITGIALRVVLPLLAAHLAGTFLTFVMVPSIMFQHHDPLLLTADGEFVLKNLVLICAAVVLLTHAGAGARLAAARDA